MASTKKIIRTPSRAEGGITEAEREAMAEHHRKWCAIAMRTEPTDQARLVAAIRKLYRVSGLKEPRVVIVPSPRIMAFAGGFSAAIWHLRKGEGHDARAATDAATHGATADATRDATDDATHAATRDATADATHGATYAATYAATRDATHGATYAATYAATRDATHGATYAATRDATHGATDAATHGATADATRDATDDATHGATYAATYAATRDATAAATYAATADGKLFLKLSKDILGPNFRLGLSCAANWGNMYQGGNMWASWDCYLTAGRDILKLRLPPHEKYQAWEECAQLGGFRLMHPEFCMVSDFPERLLVDKQNRPHCDDGPSHRWRDGWSLWFIHGVAVTEQIVMRPETITVEQIDGEANAEVRRIMITRYGVARYMQDSHAELVHELPDNYFVKGLAGAKLFRKPRPGDSDIVVCQVRNSTPEADGSVKPYWLRIDPRAYNGEAARNCHAAIASTFRMPDDHKEMAYLRWQDYRPGFES